MIFFPIDPRLRTVSAASFSLRSLPRQQIPCSHTLADSFSLFALFSTLASFVFNSLRTLCAKHRGCGYLCDISARSVIVCRFFVTPLFSWPYKLLFPQPLSFAKHLRCPRGVGSALLSELSPSFSTAVISSAAGGNFLLPQARVIVLTFRVDYVR
jgi:hypothetical protein